MYLFRVLPIIFEDENNYEYYLASCYEEVVEQYMTTDINSVELLDGTLTNLDGDFAFCFYTDDEDYTRRMVIADSYADVEIVFPDCTTIYKLGKVIKLI